eukprot:5727134-Prymnesium_polylepis.1
MQQQHERGRRRPFSRDVSCAVWVAYGGELAPTTGPRSRAMRSAFDGARAVALLLWRRLGVRRSATRRGPGHRGHLSAVMDRHWAVECYRARCAPDGRSIDRNTVYHERRKCGTQRRARHVDAVVVDRVCQQQLARRPVGRPPDDDHARREVVGVGRPRERDRARADGADGKGRERVEEVEDVLVVGVGEAIDPVDLASLGDFAVHHAEVSARLAAPLVVVADAVVFVAAVGGELVKLQPKARVDGHGVVVREEHGRDAEVQRAEALGSFERVERGRGNARDDATPAARGAAHNFVG